MASRKNMPEQKLNLSEYKFQNFFVLFEQIRNRLDVIYYITCFCICILIFFFFIIFNIRLFLNRLCRLSFWFLLSFLLRLRLNFTFYRLFSFCPDSLYSLFWLGFARCCCHNLLFFRLLRLLILRGSGFLLLP